MKTETNSAALPIEYALTLEAIKTTPMHEKCTYAHLPERFRGVVDALITRGLVAIVNGNPVAL